MKTEYLTVRFGEIKFDPGATSSFEGYGAAFGNVDAYGDVIAPGAFAQFLSDVEAGKAPWPSMLSQHGGWGMTAQDLTPVGAWTKLAEDGRGLYAHGDLAATPRGQELAVLMKMQPRPAIDGLSIGYVAKEWVPRSKPEEPRRTLKRIDLIEISPVTFPANRLARVASVKAVDDLASIRDAEDFLREFGMTKSQAVAFIAQIKRMQPFTSNPTPGEPGSEGAASGGPGDPVAEEVATALRRNAKIWA